MEKQSGLSFQLCRLLRAFGTHLEETTARLLFRPNVKLCAARIVALLTSVTLKGEALLISFSQAPFMLMLISALLLAGGGAGAPPPDFERDIAPVLKQSCGQCHAASAMGK